MKKIVILVNTISMLVFLSISCIDTQVYTQSHSGPIVSQERALASFKEIGLSIAADVYLTQGSDQSFVMEASEENLGKIETIVSNGKLKISLEKGVRRLSGKIKIYITTPEIEGLSVAGSGNIKADENIISKKMNLSIAGSGNIKLAKLSSDKINAAVAGSGNIYLSGGQRADYFQAAISGSGNVNASEIIATEADISISGSGNCKIHASESLKGRISGSGNIFYSGKPVVDIRVSGSGKAKPV